jgi:ubiquinol-cytochrome c reductase cytochrome c1 subunit
MKSLLSALALATLLALPVWANEGPTLEKQSWSFNSVKSQWNKDELLRGYTVATQVCMACHSFKYISHRDLMRAGFTETEVQTLAKNMNMSVDAKLLTAQDDTTAKETFGKVPPDLSLMAKARPGGADYIYGVLTGYSEDPQLMHELLPGGLPEGAHFNLAFPGHAIAMPKPLTGPDMVTYHDKTEASVKNMAHDVATFMQWTAEPERMERQHTGVYVLIYLVIFTILTYLTKRFVWKNVKH